MTRVASNGIGRAQPRRRVSTRSATHKRQSLRGVSLEGAASEIHCLLPGRARRTEPVGCGAEQMPLPREIAGVAFQLGRPKQPPQQMDPAGLALSSDAARRCASRSASSSLRSRAIRTQAAAAESACRA